MSLRPGFEHMSIRRRLTLMTLLSSSAALLAAGVAFIAYDAIAFREGMARRLGATAEILALNGASALVFQDQESAAQTLAALKATPRVIRAAFLGRNGEPFASYERAGAEAPSGARLSPAPPGEPSGQRFESDRLIVTRQVVWEGSVIGGLRIENDLTEIDERVRRYAGIVVLVSLGSCLVAYLVASRLQRGISGPILHLADTAALVSRDKDYSLRARPAAGGELALLTTTFNEMLAEIQKRDEELGAARADLEQRVAGRTRELEVANRELEAFSYSVSHDLRSPLRGIDGFSQALLEDYGDKFDAQGLDYLRRVRAGAQRMAHLIDDLLKLSRISRQDMHLERVDLSALAQSVADEVRGRDPDRPASVRVQEGLCDEADPRLLRVALENLVANAWKFTRKKPEAVIEFGAGEKNGGPPVYFLRDNGAGFDMAYAEKLFGAFQRLHAASDFEGTGIGLATVARVIRRHGGQIWAEAAPERGATFYFTLGAPAPGETGEA